MWCHSFPLFVHFALAISSPGSNVDPWTACNIMREFTSRAHGKAGHARCSSTRSTLRLFHTYVQRPQREIPHLRKCPYKEGVGTAQNQIPLHVVWRSLPPFGRLMDSCYYYECYYYYYYVIIIIIIIIIF